MGLPLPGTVDGLQRGGRETDLRKRPKMCKGGHRVTGSHKPSQSVKNFLILLHVEIWVFYKKAQVEGEA